MSNQSKMCEGRGCPLRDTCYRYTREPDKLQEYYTNTPYDSNGERCDFYLPKWVLDELKTNKKNEFTYNNIRDQKGRKIS